MSGIYLLLSFVCLRGNVQCNSLLALGEIKKFDKTEVPVLPCFYCASKIFIQEGEHGNTLRTTLASEMHDSEHCPSIFKLSKLKQEVT